MQVDLPLFEVRTIDPADPDDPLEPEQNLGQTGSTRLIDLRPRSPTDAVRPSLAVEEPGSPRKVVSLHPPELDTNSRACMCSERAFGVLISGGACRHFLQGGRTARRQADGPGSHFGLATKWSPYLPKRYRI